MVINYTLSLEDFQMLMNQISRHHIYQIANGLNLQASSKDKNWRFIDHEGNIIPTVEVYHRVKANRSSPRMVYNLFMSYFR